MTRIAPAPIGPLTALVAGAAALTQGAIAVVALWLLVGVFVLVGVEEVLGGLPSEVDVASRMTIVGLFVVGAVGGVGETLRIVVERTLRLRTARRLAAARAPMPLAAERRELARGPVAPLRALCGTLAGVALLVALLLGGAGLSEEDAVLTIAGALALALGVAFVVAFRALRGLGGAWQRRVGDLRSRWQGFGVADEPLVATVRHDRRAGERGRARVRGAGGVLAVVDRALLAAVPIAFGIVVIGLFLRQQCRTCDPVTYDPWGERAVDGVAGVGLVLFVGTLLVAGLRGVVAIVLEAAREVVAVVAADRGRLERSAWLDAALASPRSLELVARIVGVVAAVATMLVVSAALGPSIAEPDADDLAIVAGWSALAPWALAAIALALVLGVAGAVVAQRWRRAVMPALRHDPLAGRVDAR